MPTLFFTGRKTINRNDVSVVLLPGRPQSSFTARLDLSEYKLPPEARVWVEAYHNTSHERFDFGTVADCRPIDSLKLSRFDPDDRPHFRVKAVLGESESGLLLAARDRIEAVVPADDESGGRSLLPIRPKGDETMQGRLWMLYDDRSGGYELWYNKEAPGLRDRIAAEKDPLVLGLMIPPALQMILERELLHDIGHRNDASQWLKLAADLQGGDTPPAFDPDEPDTSRQRIEDWIASAVRILSKTRGKFLERLQHQAERDHNEVSR